MVGFQYHASDLTYFPPDVCFTIDKRDVGSVIFDIAR